MNKQDADKYIFKYLDKIFGFSLDKMKNIEQAQELASDIVYQVYLSFLRKDDIINLDGYVYRIARNVYAQYIHQLETGRKFESIEGMAIPFHDTYGSIDDNDVIERLKREISYLSKRQRMVIYMHYYDKLSVKDIALRDAHCYTLEDFRANIDKAFETISTDCRFADRNEGWQDNRNEDWESLLKFMNEGKEKLSLEEYKRICDKGYIFEDRVQPAVFRTKVAANETISYSLKRYLDKKITIPSEIDKFSKEMDEAFYTENKKRYPEHVFPVAKAVWCTNTIASPTMLPRMIEKLLEKGLLEPLSDIQRKSVFSIICLPEYE